MAENTSRISIRTDPETKRRVEELFNASGTSVSDAVNLFFQRTLMEYNRAKIANEKAAQELRRASRQANVEAIKKFQEAMKGEAEKAGFRDEQDVVDYCKQVRRELWEEHYGGHA